MLSGLRETEIEKEGERKREKEKKGRGKGVYAQRSCPIPCGHEGDTR